MSRTFLLLATLTLASCAGPNYANRCSGYGFNPGTDAYASCVQQETLAQNRRAFDVLNNLPAYQPRPITW